MIPSNGIQDPAMDFMAGSCRPDFDALKRLPLTLKFQEAFRKATGIPLTLVPAEEPLTRFSFGKFENPFCTMLARHPAMARTCRQLQSKVQQRWSKNLAPLVFACPAGLCMVAAPVVVGGCHVATWLGGQVFHRKVTRTDFSRVAARLERLGIKARVPRLRSAFFRTRIVPKPSLHASLRLLRLYTAHLCRDLEHSEAFTRNREPGFLRRTREFVQEHLTRDFSLEDVAAAAHLVPCQFCRAFQKATGMPFSDYVPRLRVEAAKALLMDGSLNIGQIRLAAGFRSNSQFQEAFRKWTGTTPSRYRAAQRRRLG